MTDMAVEGGAPEPALTPAADAEPTKEDITECVDTAIAEGQAIAYDDSAGPTRLRDAVSKILDAEKKARLASDLQNTRKACLAIVELCHDCGDWKELSANILIISKRRSQLKQVITETVQKAMGFLEGTPDVETKVELLDTLRTVTEGKIYVELERARLTDVLAKIKEAKGDVEGAADILQEVQVETIGSMGKREKTDYILEQMRLCLLKQDYIRTMIISKKINSSVFEGGKLQDLKVRFYLLMIDLHSKDKGTYLEVAKAYFAIFDTPTVQTAPAAADAMATEEGGAEAKVAAAPAEAGVKADKTAEEKEAEKAAKEAEEAKPTAHDWEGRWEEALKCVVIYLALACYGNEQNDFTNRVSLLKQLPDLPMYMALNKKFLTDELVSFASLSAEYKDELLAQKLAFPADNAEVKEARYKELHDRVTEHNIRIVAKCYTRVTSARLAQLLDLPAAEAEEHVSRLVVQKIVFAKIDRLDGVIVFKKKADADETLNTWGADINSLLQKVERTCHLIAREEMIADAAKKEGKKKGKAKAK